MLNIILRVIIIYLVALFVIRIMGKRQIGEMEPFELVITLIIADLATIPMSDPTIPLWYGILPLFLMAIIHFILSKIQMKSKKFRDLISGKPVTIVDQDGINKKALSSLNISNEEFFEMLRNEGFTSIDEIETAVIERNGKLSVIEKEEEEED
ncbi:MAG: DUF421 domain-containing protein [Christensenellaceae bacterium]|jgi:uncharacterized membrane protein YcaP (DUF421 family)|nr:DUF421 domain-containing protein [Christensenellaceae bacterium]